MNRMDASFPEMLEWGWRPWPDSEEYSYFFMRVLATAQGGAASISECISASKNIVPGDGASWFRAWNRLAETNRARADQAFERGSLQAAASNWLRASNYHRTSELFLSAEDGKRRAAILDMRKCAQSYLGNSFPKGEILQMPFGKRTMEAYYLRANGIAPQPVVVCVGGADDFKEDLLCSVPRIASESGYSVLLVDVIGSGTGISTTLADLFTLLLSADLSSTVRASQRSWLNDEIDDGLAYGRQARLRRRTVDSFFSAPLVRDGDAGGMRKRSWS
ncbi:hypothetical protein SAMN05444321_4332 [Bradyrhizobium lablabi]|nr:hypothetical protein SAMN05444321_4332 [Bradyrhizobium lablabi]